MKFLNTRIDNLTFDEALQRIEELTDSKEGGYVVTPNVDHIVQLERNPAFRRAYEESSLVLTDGKPLIWFSHLLHCPIKEKISGSDLFPRLCALAARRGYKMYFLGAGEGIAAKAAENLRKKYPGLQVVGIDSPEYGFEKDPARTRQIWEQIQECRPDLLAVGLGTPKQELFLWQNRKRLADNGILAFGLGASFDFEAGVVRRAPKWMQRCGLEWFYRLCREPRRLFKRYFGDGLRILPIVWKYRKSENGEDG